MTRRLARPVLVALAVLVPVAIPAAALAQWEQTSSSAVVELSQSRAEVAVMVSVKNDAETAMEAQLGVSIGTGAATGLAMLSPHGANLWREADLDKSEAAMTRYLRMSSAPVASTPLSAILTWQSVGYFDLWTSVPAKAQQFLSYKFVVPVDYSAGQYRVEIPALDYTVPGFVNVHLADNLAEKGGKLVVDDVASPDGRARVAIDASHTILWSVPTTEPVFGEIAVLPSTKEEALVDYHVDLASRVAEVPDHARVVVLLDASRSLGDAQAWALVSAAKSYLHAFRGHDATAALIAFDRGTRSLDPSGAFVASADAEAILAGMIGSGASATLGNGSNLDVALAKASDLLAPESGPKRVVLFTDLATADRLTPESLKGKLPSGALLHIAKVASGGARLVRDDDSTWASLPRATGGLVWAGAATEDDDDQRSVFEELARPKRIDLAKVSPRRDGDDGTPATYVEGSRIASSSFRATEAALVTLDGELWSQPFKKTFGTTASYRKLAAGLVFATSAYEHLDDDAKLAFANIGHVVSPVTSLVAKDGPAAPFDRDSFGRGGFGGGGIGTSSCCCAMGPRHGDPSPPTVDPQTWFDGEVGAIRLACDPTGGAKIAVETTFDEIVDVRVEGASTEAASECITEKVWALDLDAGFRYSAFAHLWTKS